MNLVQIIDYGSKIALVIIAAVNLSLAFHSFVKKRQDDAAIKESDRKIDWLKSLILTPNLNKFYEFFDSLETCLEGLKDVSIDHPDDDKALIDARNSDLFIRFRKQFMIPFSSVDEAIYKQILDRSDNLQSALSTSLFDETLDFRSNGVVESQIMQLISDAKRDILATLFSYRGEIPPLKPKSDGKGRKLWLWLLGITLVISIAIAAFILGENRQKSRINALETELKKAKSRQIRKTIKVLHTTPAPNSKIVGIHNDSLKK